MDDAAGGELTERDVESIAALLQCPIPWKDVCPDEEFALQLRFMWMATVWRHQIDGESRFLSYEDWEPDLTMIESLHDLRDLKTRIKNAEIWYPRAKQDYSDAFERFSELRVADPDTYPKHYALPGSTDAEVASESLRRNDGVLYPRCDVEWQRRLAFAALGVAWLAVEECWSPVEDHNEPAKRAEAFSKRFSGSGLSLLVELDYPLGCAEGMPQCHGLLKYSFTRPFVFHAYPCRKENYHQSFETIYIPREMLEPPGI